MNRGKRPGLGLAASAVAIGLFLAADRTVSADEVSSASRTLSVRERMTHEAGRAARWLADWYRRTPPSERVTWGGLVACGGLASFVLLERMFRLRLRRVVPPAFTARFVDHLHDGRLDGGQALDHCERNPSPAARVALAAVRRWGRPAADLERAVALAHRVETDRLNCNVGTLRRAAALSALLGVLGTLFALGRALESIPASAATAGGPAVSAGPAWGPAVASALAPLSTGLVIATLALVAYDGVQSRVEQLAGALDRLGAETIEAIAMSAPPPAAPIAMARTPHSAIPVRRKSSGAGANPGARGQNVPE